ncbi:protein TolQ [Aliidiomarina sp. Khilg15.8]
MEGELSIWDLLLQASLLVQAVMLLLVFMSVLSWAIIFQRKKLIGQSAQHALKFEDRFWSGVDLARLYKELSAKGANLTGLERIFHAGFREFARLRGNPNADSGTVVAGAQRAMRVAHSRELDKMEVHLSVLATIGSISPYIGLFGTVWGIMNAFTSLGSVQQATLAMVAPDIAEALIATALGLFAAIPAVIAYNRFTYRVELLDNSYINFMEEFSGILQRQTMNSSGTVEQVNPGEGA